MINSSMFWLILGILLLLSEFLIPGFTIFFFGLGAILTSILLYFIPPLSGNLFLIFTIFLVSSISLFVFLRNKFKNTLKGELFKERNDYIGKECVVIETVTAEKTGRILFQGTTWNAYSTKECLKKNQRCIILGKKIDDPLIFIIKKIEEKE